MSGSFVAQAFHRVAVVSGAFDDAGVVAVADRVEVASAGGLGTEFGARLSLVVRGKRLPDRRACRR